MPRLALALLLSLPMLSATASTLDLQEPAPVPTEMPRTVPFKVGGAGVAPVGCSFLEKDLPADTVVVAAGSYSGRKLPFQIDQSGHEATQFDVAVHSDKPVALLLSAYEPTVWSIGWTENTKIVAVFATGYHKQVVAGLPKGTPLILASVAEKGFCGGNYSSGNDLTWVNPKSREVFGKDALRFYNRPTEGVFDITESTRSKSAYGTSPDTSVESFKDKTAPLAGTLGLEQAVTDGLIRKLTPADVELVRAYYLAQAPKLPLEPKKVDVPPIAGAAPAAPPSVPIPSFSMYRSYFVLKPFVYPAGLYGGNLAYFVIPKGVPAPGGNPGHSTVVDLNKAVGCSGPLCGH